MDSKIQRRCNPLKPLQWYRDIRLSKERREQGIFLLEGPRALSLITEHNPEVILELLVDETNAEKYSSFGMVRILTDKQFLSISGNKTPQGVLAVLKLPDNCYTSILPATPGQRILMLDSIQDPGNIGTLIRTAAAFDFDGIIMNDTCADPFSQKAVQASAGTLFSLWIRRTNECISMIAELKKNGFIIIAADIEGCDEMSHIKQDKSLLMLGSEGKGLSREFLLYSDLKITIPFNRKSAESLNVAVAGAICMYCMKN